MLPGFDRHHRERWTGNRLPAPYQGERSCTRCGIGTVVTLDPFVEEALFFHGGYGEARRRTVAVCLACGRSSVMRVESIRPSR